MALTQLEIARQIIAENSKKHEEINNDINLNDFVINLISSNICSTIGIKYELGEVFITSIVSDNVKLTTFPNYTEDAYLDFCKDILHIDPKEQFNCSKSFDIRGVKTRIYAMMPPFCKTPDITISTTKIPPQNLDQKTISDENFNKIVHNNFIIVGASGSGKTYLMNYLLSKFISKSERIALIEEFSELIPPNKLTSSIIIPPPKPGELSMLEFVTQQSNLMRLDAFYIGEVKGKEAWPMLVNMASGTRGGCTIHGENALQGLHRLRALCSQSCDSLETIDDFIAKSIKYVIVMKQHKIISVNKLTGTHHNGNFAMEEIFS